MIRRSEGRAPHGRRECRTQSKESLMKVQRIQSPVRYVHVAWRSGSMESVLRSWLSCRTAVRHHKRNASLSQKGRRGFKGRCGFRNANAGLHGQRGS